MSRAISRATSSASSTECVEEPTWCAWIHRSAGAVVGALDGARRVAGEPSLVDPLGDEGTHVRVHPPRLGEEHAAVGGDGGVLAEQVLEHAGTAAARVGSLRHLGELLGVAQQDHVRRRAARGECVREGQLAGLVDDEHVDRCVVHVAAREQPRGPRHEVELLLGALGVGSGVGDRWQGAAAGRGAPPDGV
jgi:hypothetical protein